MRAPAFTAGQGNCITFWADFFVIYLYVNEVICTLVNIAKGQDLWLCKNLVGITQSCCSHGWLQHLLFVALGFCGWGKMQKPPKQNSFSNKKECAAYQGGGHVSWDCSRGALQQEMEKKKDLWGQEGGRRGLGRLYSKKFLYRTRNWLASWLFHLRRIIQRLLMHYGSFILLLLWWMRFAACGISSPTQHEFH